MTLPDSKFSSDLTIQEAAKFLKVSQKTLRRWEQRNILIPTRTSGKHRRYSKAQLLSIKPKKNKKLRIVNSYIPMASRTSTLASPQIYSSLQIDQKRVIKKMLYLAGVLLLTLSSIKIISHITPNAVKKNINETMTRVFPVRIASMDKQSINKESKVLALTSQSIADQSFNVYVKTNLKNDASVDGNLDIGGVLNLSGNTITSVSDIIIDPGGGGVTIGTGIPTIDLANGDFFVSGELEIGASLTLSQDTIADFTGTGLQVINNVLETVIGDTVESSEISDEAITVRHLSVTNTPSDNQVLTYNSATGTFTWAEDKTGTSSLFTDAGTVTYLTSLTDDFAIGGLDSTAALFFDESAGDLTITGNLAVNGDMITADGATLTINAGGNVDIQDSLTADSITTDVGGVTIASGQDVTIGLIGLNDTGSDEDMSGASLVGVFAEFANSSGTNVQDVLDDLDAAIGAGSSKWSQQTGFIYLNNTTDEVIIGGNSSLSSKLAIDGDSNEIQLLVQGNSTQSSDLVVFEDSLGNNLFDVDNSGNLEIAGDITINSETISDFTGDGLTLSANALTIQTITATNGLSSTVSNGSGLEVFAGGIGLLQGCANGEVLKWNEANDSWECSTDSGAAFAIVNIENNDSTVGVNVDTIDFSSDFSVTASPANEANVTIADDILNFTELSDTLSLDSATSIDLGALTLSTLGTGALDFNSTGQVSFSGNVDAENGLDVTNASFTVGGTNATITTAGVITGTQLNIDSLTVDGTNIGLSSDLDLLSFADNLFTVNGSGVFTSTLSVYGTTLGLNSDADTDNVFGFNAASAGSASGDLYWGDDLVCDVSETNCGWTTSVSAFSSWTIADDDTDTYSVVDANILRFTSSDGNILTNLTNGDDGDENLDFTVRLLGDAVAGSGLTGGADNVLVGADGDTTFTVGAGNGITVNADDVAVNQDYDFTFTGNVGFTPAGTDDLTITLDSDSLLAVNQALSGTANANSTTLTLTNASSSGTQNGLVIDNAASSGATEALLVLDNSDTDTAVATGLSFVSEAGGITTGIDLSDTDIVTALDLDANFLLFDGVRMFESTTGTLTFEDTSGNDLMTITDNANVGDVNITGNLSVDGTTLGLNDDADTDNVFGFNAASAGSASGDLYWGDDLVCDVSETNCGWTTSVSAFSSFTVAGDSGGGQEIADSNTLSIIGGTNGIDTVDSTVDTVTINLDTTEIGTTTFGSGSAITWTYNASGGVDTSLGFGDNTILATTNNFNFTGAIDIQGGNITLQNDETISNSINSEVSLADGTNTLTFDFDEDSATAIDLTTNGSVDLTFNPGGNVGIGTRTPSGDLHVVDSDTSNIIISTTASTGANYLGIEFHDSTGAKLAQFVSEPTDDTFHGKGSFLIDYNGEDFGGIFAIRRDPDTTDYTIFADADGNVGINNSNPEALFDIKGNEAEDATFILDADEGDDIADTWTLTSVATDNDLTFTNGTTEVLSLTSAGNMQVDGTFEAYGNTLGLNSDADTDNVFGFNAASAGSASGDLYWGDDLVCDVSETNCGWTTSVSAFSSWTIADDDTDTYSVVDANILRFTSSDGNILTNLTNGDDGDENLDFTVRLLGDAVAGSGLTGGADNVLVGADGDTTFTVGAGNGITVNADDVAVNQDYDFTFTGNVGFTPAGTDDLTITLDSDSLLAVNQALSGTANANSTTLTLTNASSSGTQNGLVIDNAASSGATEALLVLDNSDTDTAVATGLSFVSEAGGITTGIDLSDTDIVTALDLDANFLLFDGVRMFESTTGTLTFEDTSGNDLMTITDNANVGDVNITGNLSVDGTTLGLNDDADTDNVFSFNAASAGSASGDLYWGDDLVCDVSETNCGWTASSGSSKWSVNTTPTPDVTYLTETAYDLAIGGSDGEAPLFIDVSASALNLNPFGASAGNTGEVRFQELEANGDNYTGFKAPDVLAGNVIYTLPTADGGNQQVLSTNSNGVLSWIDVSAGSGGYTGWNIDGDDSDTRSIGSGETLIIQGGTNGINTDVSDTTDTITLNLDTTEIAGSTFGAGSDFTWTFNTSGATDPSLDFGDNDLDVNVALTTFSGNVAIDGNTLGLNSDADTDNVFSFNAASAGSASGDLYWGDDLVCDVSETNCGWTTSVSAFSSWTIADDDTDTYSVVDANILRFTSSDGNILTNLTNGDDGDENLDFTVRLLGDAVAGSGLTGGADNVLVGADGDTTFTVGAGNGITVNADDVAVNQDYDFTFTGNVGFTPAGTDDLTITLDSDSLLAVNQALSGTANANSTTLTLTNASSSGTQNGLVIDNAASSGATEALLVLDNSDTDTAVATGLSFVSEAGGITTGIDLSDTDIVTALDLDANFLLFDGVRMFESTTGTLTFEDTSGNDLMTITDNANVGDVNITGNLSVDGTTLGLNDDADTDNVFSFNAASAGSASGDLYWGDDLVCDVSETNCGWTTSVSAFSSWTIADDDTDTYSVVDANILRFTSSDGNILTNLTNGDDGDENLDFTVRLLGDAVAGSGLTGGADNVLVGADGDTTFTVGAGNGITVNADDVAVNQDYDFTFTGNVGFTPAGTDDLTITLDSDSLLAVNQALSGTANANSTTLTLTNASSSGTQNGLVIDNAASSGATEALLVLDNSDTDTAVATGLSFVSEAGGITTGIDLSDTDIVTALDLDANFLLFDGVRMFESTTGTLTFEDTSGNDLMTITDNANVGDVNITGNLSVDGTTLGLNDDADTDNVFSFNAASAGSASGDLYWGDDLVCDVSETNCGWTTSVSAFSSWTIADDDTDTYSVVDANILRFTSSDGNILTNLTNGDDGDENLDFTVRLLGDAVAGSGLTGGADNVLVGADGDTTFTVGAGNGITVNADDVAVNQDYDFTFTGNVGFTPAGTDDLTITLDSDSLLAVNQALSGTANANSTTLTLTNASSSGTQNGLVIDNAASSGATEALLVLDNSDTDTAVATGLSFVSEAGGITTGIDLSDTDIVTALDLDANFLLFDGVRMFESTTGTLTFEDTSGNDLMTITDNANVGDVNITGNLSVDGTTLGLNDDADTDNVFGFNAASAGSASGDLYWGDDLVCDVSETNCGWTTSVSAFSSWTIADDDTDTYSVVDANILRFTSSDGNILTNLTNGDDGDENLDFTVRLLGDAVAGSGLTGGADNVLVGADGDTTFTVGAGNGITVNADDVAVNQDYDFTFTGNVGFTPAGTDDLTITLDSDSLLAVNQALSGTANANSTTLTLTNASSSGTQNGLVIDNAASSGATEALLVLDNSDTDTAVATGLSFVSEAGGITTGIDLSDTDIVTALDLDANFLLFDGVRMFESTTGTLTFEDTSGNDLMTITDNANVGDVNITGNLSVDGTTLGLNDDADTDNVFGFNAASAGSASGDLYWGDDLVCDVSETNCGWTTSVSAFSSWTIADDDTDTYSVVDANILRFTSSDGNILTNLTNGDDGDENLDFTVRLLGDAVAGSGLTGGADNVLVGADGDTTFTVGAGNGITVNADDVAVNQDYDFTFTGNVGFTPAGTDDLTITLDSDSLLAVNQALSGTANANSTTLTLTNASSSGTQNGLVIDNAASSGATEALLVLDNSDTDTAVATGLSFVSEAGGITTGIDLSDTDIVTALDLDANFLLFDGVRMFESTTGTLTFEDTSGNDLMTITDNANVGDVNITGNLSVDGTTLGLNDDADTDNVFSFNAASAGSASGDLYWGDDLVCDVSETNCGWTTSVSAFSSWTIADDDTDTYSVVDANILRFTSSDGNILTNLTNGDDGDENLDFTVRLLGDAVAGSGLTGGADNVLVGADGDTTFTVGAGNGITVNADDVAVNQDYDFTFTGNVGFTPAGTDDLTITLDSDSLLAVNQALSGTANANSTTLYFNQCQLKWYSKRIGN
ncbi:MerR family DNA-binding transcriptional regulator [Candidatus Woesebacteria bacterium]|nr:MAG: MerR family DNA-binding transcriptional regulator [Candidatus Woesebacteria bacterium]